MDTFQTAPAMNKPDVVQEYNGRATEWYILTFPENSSGDVYKDLTNRCVLNILQVFTNYSTISQRILLWFRKGNNPSLFRGRKAYREVMCRWCAGEKTSNIQHTSHQRAQRQICLTQHVFKTSTAQTRKWLSYVNICKKHTLRMFHGVVWNHIPPQRIRTPVEVLVLRPVLTHLMLYGHRPKHSKCHTAFSLNPPKQTALYSVPANAQAWLHDM